MHEEILFDGSDAVDSENAQLNREPLPPDSNDEPSDASSGSTGAEPISDVSEHNTMDALRDLLRQSVETKTELAETRNLVRKMIDRELVSENKASEDEFIRQLKEHYQSDPFQGAAMLVGKAREDLQKIMDQKIYEALGAREQFSRLLDDFLDDPLHQSLKTFRNELEFLIRDRGVEPKEAAEFLKSVEGKARKAAVQKAETMREVRNRATTEQGSRPMESIDPDRELTRAFRQARNLDEMFAVFKRVKM
ncbi:MAG: hypothetical protein ACP5U1_10910 [Desulfomonilaceae bacterium]